MKYPAVILAGGRLEKSLAPFTDAPNKAFMKLGDRILLEYSIEIIASCRSIDRIFLVADSSFVPGHLKEKIDKIAEPGGSIVGSLKSGLSCLDETCEIAVIMPSDAPFLTPDAVEDFLSRCEKRKADFCYSIVSRETSEKKYPGIRHTYVRLKEGAFCGGSLILFDRKIMEKAEDLAKKITDARKKPWTLAGILGTGTIARLLFRQLSIADLERKMGSLLGCSAAAIHTSYAEVGFNIDGADDYIFAREIIEGRR